MYRKSLLVVASLGILLLASGSFAVVEHETVRYERPVRTIRGRLTGFGYVVPTLGVQVFDNGQLGLDDSMALFEKRQRQNLVASVEPNDKGEFNVKHLPKGLYEVEFGNQGNGGYNILSVLVNVDPKGAKDAMCVDVSLEGAPSPRSSVRRCTPEKKRANNVLETLRVRPLAEVRTGVRYGSSLTHDWAWFFVAVEQPDGSVKPIQIAYAFDKSDQLPPESFWDYSKLYEAKVRRDAGCDFVVETRAYVRNITEDGNKLPRSFVLRFARGAPEGLLKMESAPPCYVLWHHDYRKVNPKNE
jgi:hypothetical protein